MISSVRRFISRFVAESTTRMSKSAGILVIGDEILKGHTKDTNSHFLSKLLHSSGVTVERITIIGDEIEEIASEVRWFSKTYDYVLTSGGIGPTHDDKTYEAVALAFMEKTVPHPTLVELCKKYFGDKPMNTPELKLAFLPESATLHFGSDSATGRCLRYPLAVVKNVFLFPGIPSLLEKQALSLSYLFKGGGAFFSKELLLDVAETAIAKLLTSCQDRFSSAGVSIGSYPDPVNNYYKVKVIVESKSSEATETAVKFLMDSLPREIIVENYVENPMALRGRDVFAGLYPSHSLRMKVTEAIKIIEQVLERYPLNELCIGFNGGKDCTVLLHMFYAVLRRKFPDGQVPILSLYVKDAHPFEEVSTFMEESRHRYKLELVTIDEKIKPALEKLKKEHPHVKAVLMGTRYTDPYSRNLKPFSPTDEGWPEYMRINPMLNWSYHDVWEFLRTLCLPYCILYDHGYTSLGSRENTRRNDKLRYMDENSVTRYKPAYTLQDVDLERNGRL